MVRTQLAMILCNDGWLSTLCYCSSRSVTLSFISFMIWAEDHTVTMLPDSVMFQNCKPVNSWRIAVLLCHITMISWSPDHRDPGSRGKIRVRVRGLSPQNLMCRRKISSCWEFFFARSILNVGIKKMKEQLSKEVRSWNFFKLKAPWHRWGRANARPRVPCSLVCLYFPWHIGARFALVLGGVCGHGHRSRTWMASAVTGASLEAVILDTQLIQARGGESACPWNHSKMMVGRPPDVFLGNFENILHALFFLPPFVQFDSRSKEEPGNGRNFSH